VPNNYFLFVPRELGTTRGWSDFNGPVFLDHQPSPTLLFDSCFMKNKGEREGKTKKLSEK